MTLAILHAVTQSEWTTHAAALLDNPLGLATLADVYVGFFIASAWIVFRARRLSRGLLWTVLILVLGNLITSVAA